jgi:hypothetical protein
MKKLIVTICLFFCGYYLFAQNLTTETEIKSLEQDEVQAVLNKDTNALKKLWDKDYIVNNPENKIVLAKSNSVDRPVLQKQRTSFTREVEKMAMLQFQWAEKWLYQWVTIQNLNKLLKEDIQTSG